MTALNEETALKIHAIQTGRLTGNETFLRGQGWSSLLRRRKRFEFPVFVYIVEHPDGHIAIDAGPSARGWPTPGPSRRFLPSAALLEPSDEIGPQMQMRGLDPSAVRAVVLTHLDPDHVGGIAHFRNAEHLVHRPEHQFAWSRQGRLRSRPQDWPPWFQPTLYDLEPQPYGPFPASRPLTPNGDVRLVPLPGHTIGQVGVVGRVGDTALFFVADHMLSEEWFSEDRRTGRLTNMGIAAPRHYAETNRRVVELLESGPVVLLPAHDPKAPDRLSAQLSGGRQPTMQ